MAERDRIILMATSWQDPDAVRFMLDDCETWAVVGLSGDPTRTAFSIAALLQGRGKRVVPIHPSAAEAPLEVLGEQAYASLADVPFAIDVVDVFRRSEAAGEFADQAVAVGAKAVWFQLGVIDEAAFERTTAAGRADGDGHLPRYRVAPSLTLVATHSRGSAATRGDEDRAGREQDQDVPAEALRNLGRPDPLGPHQHVEACRASGSSCPAPKSTASARSPALP